MKPLSLCTTALLVIVSVGCQQVGNAPVKAGQATEVKVPKAANSAPSYTAANAKDLKGIWYVEFIAERAVIDYSPARIQFADKDAINGNASCNRFFGTYTYIDQKLVIPESLGATKMMCLPALMEQEKRLFTELPNAVQASLENNLLVLRDENGRQIIKASREQQ